MAEAELRNAATWYDERSPGLGLRFILAIHKKSDEILESPQRWPLAAGSRRVLMGRYPYALVYREASEEEIEIVAVAHLKRRLGYWVGR
jgi:plasmid stabilization system protein ParE